MDVIIKSNYQKGVKYEENSMLCNFIVIDANGFEFMWRLI